MAINKMLKFVDISRDMPTKRVPNLRKKDYNEVYQEFAAEKAAEQSSRCSPMWSSILPNTLPSA